MGNFNQVTLQSNFSQVVPTVRNSWHFPPNESESVATLNNRHNHYLRHYDTEMSSNSRLLRL